MVYTLYISYSVRQTRITALFYYYPAYTLIAIISAFIVKSLITILQNEGFRILRFRWLVCIQKMHIFLTISLIQWRTYILGTLELELLCGPLRNQQQQVNIQQGPKGFTVKMTENGMGVETLKMRHTVGLFPPATRSG